jgi:outer membrane lipoprotein-sorting protein
MSGFCLNAEEIKKGKTMTDQEIDTFIEKLFKKHEKLKFFTAEIKQSKSGGIYKREVTKSGTITANLPDKFLLDMSDDGLKITVDGKYAWVYDTDLDDVERWTLDKHNNEGKSFDIASFFLGTAVKTAKELRKEFEIKGTQASTKQSFFLSPKTGKMKENIKEIILTFAGDETLPCYVKTTAIPKKGSNRPPQITSQIITNQKTNLDGLAPIKDDTFIFNPTKDMEIRDMDAKGGPKNLIMRKL